MSRDDHLSWFHGKVSREHAEEIVKSGAKILDKIFASLNNIL